MKINVLVHPKSKRPRIEYDMLGTIHVFVKEIPLKGSANLGVKAALSKFYSVKKSNVRIVSGLRSKNKIIEVIEDNPI